MSALLIFIYALVVLVSLLLIGLILIQPSKSGGMGAAFGGIGESVFGGKTGSHLTRATVWMTAIFLVLTLLLAILIGHGVKGEEGTTLSEMETVSPAVEAPASVPAENK